MERGILAFIGSVRYCEIKSRDSNSTRRFKMSSSVYFIALKSRIPYNTLIVNAVKMKAPTNLVCNVSLYFKAVASGVDGLYECSAKGFVDQVSEPINMGSECITVWHVIPP